MLLGKKKCLETFDPKTGRLGGGLEHEFYDFPYIGKNHPNDELIFFREVEITNQTMIYMVDSPHQCVFIRG